MTHISLKLPPAGLDCAGKAEGQKQDDGEQPKENRSGPEEVMQTELSGFIRFFFKLFFKNRCQVEEKDLLVWLQLLMSNI